MRILFLAVTLVALPARAESPWLDVKNGCGRGAAFAKSGKVEDLPGCSGKLPKDAPPIEVVLHDTKRALLEAEEQLEKNKLDKVDAQLAEAERALKTPPHATPEMPDRWEAAHPQYERAVASIKSRRRLAPHLDKLRAAHRAMVESRAKNSVAVEGGPAAALKASDECVAAFAAARAANVDLAVSVELEKDRPRVLAEALAECESLKIAAVPRVKEQEKAKKQKRAALRKQVKGERLKIFDAHPNALPEIAGGTVGTAAEWKYTGDKGVEVYTFRGNKLVSRK